MPLVSQQGKASCADFWSRSREFSCYVEPGACRSHGKSITPARDPKQAVSFFFGGGRGIGPRGLEMAAACPGVDSQDLATILDPFRIIFADLGPGSQISAVQTGQMSSAETGQMFAVSRVWSCHKV